LTKIKFYNTASRQLEDFKPITKGKVGLYSCGPTVYDEAHIGNLRAYICNDILYRFLKAIGYDVRWVMNITDIDDKMIKRAKEEKTTIGQVAQKYEKKFLDDLRSINIGIDETKIVRATDHFKEMKELTDKLVQKGYAYKADDGIYFSVAKFKDYGKFAGIEIDTAKSRERVKNDTYDKSSPQDFALWKNDSDFADGRPGWHIECSAMSTEYLGQPFDIHTGGVDLIFPHHQNEIAQSEAATGKKLANYWLHNEHLLVDGAKMSKSLRNFYTLRDVLKKKYSATALRFELLQAHYRSKLDFGWEAMTGAETVVRDLRRFWAKSALVKKSKTLSLEDSYQTFVVALADDLNMPTALAVVFGVVNNTDNEGPVGRDFLRRVDEILGLDITNDTPPGVQALLEAMDLARSDKNFIESDRLRLKIEKLGYQVENSPVGSYAIAETQNSKVR
jgi:cysteinyl-tRNA synthetase